MEPHRRWATLAILATVGWGVPLARAQGGAAQHASASFVVAVQHESRVQPDVESGLRFGEQEASRTLQLVGRGLRLVAETGRSAPPDGGAGAAGSIHTDGDAVWLQLSDPPSDPNTSGTVCRFDLAVSPARRDAVRAAWLAREEALNQDPVQVVEWHASLRKYGAAQLNERFARATGSPMTAGAWVAWAAVKTLAEASMRRAADEHVCDTVAALRLDGHKGQPLRFDPSTRELLQPLYVVRGATVLAEIDPG